MYLNWLEHFVISFMKIKNRRGHKNRSLRNPKLNNSRVWVYIVWVYTCCYLFVRYERNQSKVIPRKPQVFNFDSRISWLTQSNALRKSRNKENTIYRESICLYKYCKKCKMAWVVDFLAGNPLLLLLLKIGNTRPGEGDWHPISPKTPATHYQTIEEKKRKCK